MSDVAKPTEQAAPAPKRSLGGFLFEVFCAVIFLGMIGMVFLNAILRYCFNSGYPPSEEWARFLFIYITFFGAIEGFYHKKHIAVDLFTNMLSGATRKTVEIVATLFTLASLVLLLIGGCIYVAQTADTIAISTHVNMALINCALPIMAGVACIFQLRDLWNTIRRPASDFKSQKGVAEYNPGDTE